MKATRLLPILAIVLSTQLVFAFAEEHQQTPPTPIFAHNYQVDGVLSLPYAELNEPFKAWYDKKAGRSRTDYYGDLYQVFQFAPSSAPKNSEYGAMYQMVYVPADYVPGKVANEKQIKLKNKFALRSTDQSKTSLRDNSKTKRACFVSEGSVGGTVGPQTVLPDLSEFQYDSIGDCPHKNFERRHRKCEMWKMVTDFGEKKNTYKMWIWRNETGGQAIPVYYYMLGYDTLLGSHYDRYDVTYHNFKPNSASDADFDLGVSHEDCGSMNGPGDTDSERRVHMVIQNPIHEYVVEPHRYDHIDHEFDKFVKKHDKDYASSSRERKSWFNFLHNFRFINSKNRELKDYKLKVNHLADNNIKELTYLRGRLHSKGYNGGLDYAEHHNLGVARANSIVPSSWDWTIRGAVTPVKDQAVCGSCWSYGTTGTVEGANFVKTGKLLKLSEQQLVDCSWDYGNNGCNGGEDFRAYKYIKNAGGLATEDDYGHYLGIDGRCHDSRVKKSVQISGFYNVTSNNREALKHALVNYGPVSVSIDASVPTFAFYSHGVYYDPKCSNAEDGLDHSVLLVGYTELDGKFAWMIKNSWSTYWGNDGYILISAENNNCGVMDDPTVPIISSN